MAKPKTAIIGPGVVGKAAGKLLRAKRFPIAGVAGTSLHAARAAVKFIGGGRAARSASAAARGADIVLLTTPDRAIAEVCREIVDAKAVKRNAVVFHFSGAHGSDLLAPVRERKAFAAALHPMQSFASPGAAIRTMKGAFFTFDGDDEAAPVAESLVKALGGRMLRIAPENKALYHAAGCVISNYVAAIADLGVIMLTLSGLPPKDAARAAAPLLKGTADNIARLGMPQALTGPISRGDVETVERHLAALARLPSEIRGLYRQLGLYTVRVAQRKGTLHAAEARRMINLLSGRHRPGRG